MKVYDAKEQQQCRICGLVVSHNKQGRFTSHLLNTHDLSLHDYLIQYFYEKQQLICQYELCEKQVALRRGIPNRFCSKVCGCKGEPLTCVVCEKRFDDKHRKTKTCSSECASRLRSKNTSEWHKKMPQDKKLEHFIKIITKTARTRKENNTPSWNSGKTGIYSDETIEKIRNATLQQLQREVFRKTSIEKKIEAFLKSMDIPYQYSYIMNKVQFDFYLVNANILIECDGDYWHANPKFYPDESKWYETQKRIRAKDVVKTKIANDLGFKLLRFWEDDINHNFSFVETSIINALSATT